MPRPRRTTTTVATPRRRRSEAETVAVALVRALRGAASFTPGAQVRPCAILWPDERRLWDAAVTEIKATMPELYCFGAWHPEDRTGPAIWLRAIEARVAEPRCPENATPVFYLPGVSCEKLARLSECPPALSAIAEMQFRGAVWLGPNGREWTPASFLAEQALDVAGDAATTEALQRALSKLLSEPMPALTGRLDAEFFNGLVAPDMPAQLLRWLHEPASFRERLRGDGWDAFREQCRTGYGFDPERDGETKAGELLGAQHGEWAAVWSRFEDAPDNFRGVVAWLRGLQPQLGESAASSPVLNERAEKQLADGLARLAGALSGDAATALRALEKEHGARRGAVWRRLGESPLAVALEPLVRLAELSAEPLGGASSEVLAEKYAASAWQTDAEAVAALAACESAAVAGAVFAALRAIYLPWLEQGARTLAMLLKAEGFAPPRRIPAPCATEGRAVIFADGLRLDVARQLAVVLSERGCDVAFNWDWSPLPSVTASAKPFASPLANEFRGGEAADEFAVSIATSGQRATQDRFTKLLAERGWQVLGARDTGDPAGYAWTEAGTLDRRGHDEGWKLALRVREEIAAIAERIGALFSAGWREVEIVTDHGWLLLPDGLPKAELKSFLAVHRWGRCSALKETVSTDLPTAPWTWNRAITLAFPPGVHCFREGMEYAHGGISPQEMVVPRLVVRRGAASTPPAIASVRWSGARCKVAVTSGVGCQLDLRRRAADAITSCAEQVVAVGADGSATVFLKDDGDMGTAAMLVLLDPAENVAQALALTLGENT